MNQKDNYCADFQYDFDENIALSVVFGICFLVGIFLVFVGLWHFSYLFLSFFDWVFYFYQIVFVTVYLSNKLWKAFKMPYKSIESHLRKNKCILVGWGCRKIIGLLDLCDRIIFPVVWDSFLSLSNTKIHCNSKFKCDIFY